MIADEEISGGDFVRNVKQLIDLLRQLGDMAPEPRDRPARPAGGRAPVPGRGGRLVGGVHGIDEADGSEPIDAVAADAAPGLPDAVAE